MPTRERAQELAPLPRLITDEDHRDNRRQEHRLGIAEMDEEAMALLCQHFPQDIINEREFYAQRRAERDKRRAERAAYREDKRRRKADAQFNMRLGAASPWESDDDRYLHAYSQTSEEDITEEESDDEEYLNYLFLSIMLRTILYSLVSTCRSQHCKRFFKAPRVAILLEML